MKTQKKATAAGIRRVVASFDQMASLLQYHYAGLGIGKAAALDLAFRMDQVSDFLSKAAGEEPKAEEPEAEEPEAEKAASRKVAFPAETIGKKVPGPVQRDADETFMDGHFTQEKFTALAEKQMNGAMEAAAAAHRADPKLAAVAAAAARAAAEAVFNAAKSAGEKPEEPEAEEKPEAEKVAGEEPEANEEPEAEKTAAAFGLFAAR